MSKRPISPLSLDIPKGQGAVPETIGQIPPAVAPPPVANPPRTAMTYRPTITTHERLRFISFQTRRPMQELVDEAVESWLLGRSD